MQRLLFFIFALMVVAPVARANQTLFEQLSFLQDAVEIVVDASTDKETTKSKRDKNNILQLLKKSNKDTPSIDNVIDEDGTFYASLNLKAHRSTPEQTGKTASILNDEHKADTHSFKIQLKHMGFKGPKISLTKDSIDRLFTHKNRTPNEVWRSSEITPDTYFPKKRLSKKSKNKLFSKPNAISHVEPDLTFLAQLSASSGKSKILYRGSIIAGITGSSKENALLSSFLGEIAEHRGLRYHIIGGAHLRLNVASNLDNLASSKPVFVNGPRSLVKSFDDNAVAIEDLYIGMTATPFKDLHFAAGAGILEEMLTGSGAEILYRPFDENYGIGVSAYTAVQRNPFNMLALSEYLQSYKTYHLYGIYDIPKHDIQIKGEIGGYLLGDRGGSLRFSKKLKNGAEVKGFVTYTDSEDFNNTGGSGQTELGLRYSVPFGLPKPLPQKQPRHH